ncbi:MAG TPA: hypothetical protein PKK10_05445 [Woeseiaceae bacterium]|nr:hypothetical protein [Woeseiaceae bacterium]
MTGIEATVVSVHAGSNADLSKPAHEAIQLELDGIVGDRHRGYERRAWAGDKQAKGTVRRNERQWSGVSLEELAAIAQAMGLGGGLDAGTLGANFCFSGISEFSRLPRGSVLRFPSGAVVIVEEYNPPCLDMGKQLASQLSAKSSIALSPTSFSQAAKLTRGLVGVVEVPGLVHRGDTVLVEACRPLPWLNKTSD